MSFRKASREILRLIAIVPEASTACTWKYRFAISMPITLTSILISSLWFKGLRQPEPEPEPEREGRPSHHVGVAGRQPNPGAARGRNHRRRLPFTRAFTSAETVEASTDPDIRIRPPAANSISTTPAASGEDMLLLPL
jgi:hypothetical protein